MEYRYRQSLPMIALRKLTRTTAVSSAVATQPSKDEKLLNMKRTALRFKEAAANLERFLQLAPRVADEAMWRKQLDRSTRIQFQLVLTGKLIGLHS